MSEAKIRLGQVTTLETQLNTIYGQANSAYTAANGSQNSSNTVYADANTANTTAKNAYAQANLAYTAANSAQTYGNTLSTSVNSTVATINTNYQAAYAAANTGATNALNAYAQANSAYTTANNALPKAGGTMTGNLIMSAATVNTSIANISTVITGNALSIGTGIGSNSNVTISANGTEYWRLTNTGNVGIGTATPSTILQVQGSLAATTSLAALKLLSLRNSSDGGVGINFRNSVSDPLASIDALVTSTGAGTDDGILAFSTATNAVNTESARIDSSGSLLVGTTSNSNGSRLRVSGTRAATFTSTQTDAGGIIVNCASANSDEPSILGANASASASGVGTLYSSLGSGNGAQNNTNCYHLKAITQGVAINYLYGNGTTSFTSDARLKKNITSTRDGYAEDLCKLRVVKYNWNTAPEGESQELGLIAQEVEQVFPNLVQDADMKIQGFTPKVLKASVLPFMLLKAIQEQQALIQSLTTRLTAVESR